MIRFRFFFAVTLITAGAWGVAVDPVLNDLQAVQSGDASAASAAIDKIFSKTDDPHILLQAADLVQAKLVDQPVNALEYWGTDLQMQRELRPGAELLVRVLDRTEAQARGQANAVAATMHGASDSNQLADWTKMDTLARQADFKKVSAQYYRILAGDSGDNSQLPDQTIAAIKAWDTSEVTMRVAADVLIGKIQLAQGKAAAAKQSFNQAIDAAGTDVAQQYQGRYFAAVADLASGDLPAATTDWSNLLAWQKENIPADNTAWRSGASSAATILLYRIDCAQADQSDSPDVKAKYNQAAAKALKTLNDVQPDLKPAILEHLGGRFAGMKDIAKTDPLILEALVQRGAATDADAPTLDTALRAAQTVLARSGEFDSATVDYAAAMTAAILDKNGQNSDAAKAYLLLARRLAPHDVKNAAAALDRAIDIFQSEGDASEDLKPYEQALALASAPPFNRKDLLYANGRLLVQEKNYSQAADILAQVPAADPHFVDAELERMICLQQMLQTANAENKEKWGNEVGQLADDILSRQAGASTDAAEAILIAASVCNDLNQPSSAMDRLNNLAARSTGLSNQNDLLSRGEAIRIAALAKLDRPTEAADLLTQGKNANPQTVFALLKQLDSQVDITGDHDKQLAIANARVHVIEWLMNRDSQSGHEQSVQYRLLYADALRRSGELETDPTKKRSILIQSLLIYHNMNLADKDAIAPLLGGAGVEYDLENYSAARKVLVKLLANGQVGNGQTDDAYWEATYELLASNAALADHGQATPEQINENANYLKRLYVQWGTAIGGKRWHGAFEQLRKRITPNFQPASTGLTGGA